MSNIKLIDELIRQYEKFGWETQSLLLTEETQKGITKKTLDDFEIKTASFDAIWFSRLSKNQKTAWELRHINENPYALFELIEEEQELDKVLKNAETRMQKYASNKRKSKRA